MFYFQYPDSIRSFIIFFFITLYRFIKDKIINNRYFVCDVTSLFVGYRSIVSLSIAVKIFGTQMAICKASKLETSQNSRAEGGARSIFCI